MARVLHVCRILNLGGRERKLLGGSGERATYAAQGGQGAKGGYALQHITQKLKVSKMK